MTKFIPHKVHEDQDDVSEMEMEEIVEVMTKVDDILKGRMRSVCVSALMNLIAKEVAQSRLGDELSRAQLKAEFISIGVCMYEAATHNIERHQAAKAQQNARTSSEVH